MDHAVELSGAVAALAAAPAVADTADHGITAQIGVSGNAVAAVRTAARPVAVGAGVVAVSVGPEFTLLVGVDRCALRPVASGVVAFHEQCAAHDRLAELLVGDRDVVNGSILHPDLLPVFGDGEDQFADIHVESGIGAIDGPGREAEARKFVTVGRLAREDESWIAVSGKWKDSDEGPQLSLGQVNRDEPPFGVGVAEVAV